MGNESFASVSWQNLNNFFIMLLKWSFFHHFYSFDENIFDVHVYRRYDEWNQYWKYSCHMTKNCQDMKHIQLIISSIYSQHKAVSFILLISSLFLIIFFLSILKLLRDRDKLPFRPDRHEWMKKVWMIFTSHACVPEDAE